MTLIIGWHILSYLILIQEKQFLEHKIRIRNRREIINRQIPDHFLSFLILTTISDLKCPLYIYISQSTFPCCLATDQPAKLAINCISNKVAPLHLQCTPWPLEGDMSDFMSLWGFDAPVLGWGSQFAEKLLSATLQVCLFSFFFLFNSYN